MSSGLNKFKTLLSSSARMDSALILSLMDTAVKLTPANPLLILCFFLCLRLLLMQYVTTIKRRRNKATATDPAMTFAFDCCCGRLGLRSVDDGVNTA